MKNDSADVHPDENASEEAEEEEDDTKHDAIKHQQQLHHTTSATPKTFDYVIVGAGAAAMGLISGLLKHYDCQGNQDHPRRRPLTIAVVERGEGGGGVRSDDGRVPPSSSSSTIRNKNDDESSNNENAANRKNRQNNDTDDTTTFLHTWAEASLLPYARETKHCIRYASTLHGGIPYRTVDVPTGQGLGGTTNINAGLFIPPQRSDFNTWLCWDFDDTIMKAVEEIQEDIREQNALVLQEATLRGLQALGKETEANKGLDDDMQQHHHSPKEGIRRRRKTPSAATTTTTTEKMSLSSQDETPTSPLVRSNTSWTYSTRMGSTTTTSITTQVPLVGVLEEEQTMTKNRNMVVRRRNYFELLVAPRLLSSTSSLSFARKEHTHRHVREQEDVTKYHQIHIEWFHGTKAKRILLEKDEQEHESKNQCDRVLHSVGNHRVMGVEVVVASANPSGSQQTKKKMILRARRDVILSAGAIGTPQLLFSSGIGHKDELTAADITPMVHIPGVGKNLMDHPLVARLILSTNYDSYSLSANSVQAIINMEVPIPNTLVQDKTSDTTTSVPSDMTVVNSCVLIFDSCVNDVVASNLPALLLFGRSRLDDNHGERRRLGINALHRLWMTMLRFGFAGMVYLGRFLWKYSPLYFLSRHYMIVAPLIVLQPFSRGCIKPVAAAASVVARRRQDDDDDDDIPIDMEVGYLSDDRDVQVLWDTLIQSKHCLKSWLADKWDLLPGTPAAMDGTSRKPPQWFRDYVQLVVVPYFHFAGTCAMQTTRSATMDENDKAVDWVVDPSLRVRGIQGLRICDASILPEPISAPPSLTLAAIGRVFATQLLHDDDDDSY